MQMLFWTFNAAARLQLQGSGTFLAVSLKAVIGGACSIRQFGLSSDLIVQS